MDPTCGCGMGETAENLVNKYKISREEQDHFAVESHQKAAKAQAEGWFDDEVVPVEVPQKKAAPVKFDKDESIRGGLDGGEPGEAAARVPQGGRLGDGRQRLRHDGRRVRDRADDARAGARRWASRRCSRSSPTPRRRWSRSSWARAPASRSRWRCRRRG